jgi:hypothetical protein
MASQRCLHRVRTGLLVVAVLAPAWGVAGTNHDATATTPWRYGTAFEGHAPALPGVVRDALRDGGSIAVEVGLFDIVTVALTASFDPFDNRRELSADIAAPGADTLTGRPVGEAERDEGSATPMDLPVFWDMYFGTRSWLAHLPARLKVIAARVSRDYGKLSPVFGAFSPNLH